MSLNTTLGNSSMGHARNALHDNRFQFLDAARGVAASAVIFQHATETSIPAYYDFSTKWFNLGSFGVTLFFVISGFIIPRSLERGGLRRFWIARIFRLYPLYWAALAAVFLLGIAGLYSAPVGNASDLPWFAFANLTMLQEFIGQPNALGVFWTLTIEMAFYAICSGLFVFGLLNRPLLVAWLATVGLILLALFCVFILDRSVLMHRYQLLVIAFFGSVLHLHSVGKIPFRPIWPLLVAVLLAETLHVWADLYPLAKNVPDELRHHLPASLFPKFAAVGAFLIFYRFRTVAFPRHLFLLGLISYSLYLLHPLWMCIIPVGVPPPLRVAGIFAGTIVLSLLTWRWVEEPGINLGRRIYRNLNQQDNRTPSA